MHDPYYETNEFFWYCDPIVTLILTFNRTIALIEVDISGDVLEEHDCIETDVIDYYYDHEE